MKYIKIHIEFLPHNRPDIEKRVREGVRFLETMVNSQMFRDLLLDGNYIEEIPNSEVYATFTQEDWHITFDIIDGPSYMNVGFSVDPDTDVISVYADKLKYPTPRMAAILAHEYGHILGFDHTENYASSVLFYLQTQGEKVFRKFHKKLKNKKHPRQGKWLVYEPIIPLLWFWKVLRWK